MFDLSTYITPASGVAIAIVTTCGAVCLKRRHSLADRRVQREERCERLENAYNVLSFWVRGHLQSLISLKTLKSREGYGPQYVLMRLDELAEEPSPLDKLDRYVEGVEELPQDEGPGN